MKKKEIRKTCILGLSILLLFALTACGGGNDQTDEGNPPSNDAKPLTEEEYTKKVASLYEEIQSASTDMNAAAQKVDADDPNTIQTMNAEIKSISEKTVKRYQELSVLKAPEKYKDAQAKIADGAEAASQSFQISAELTTIAFDQNLSDSDRQKKIDQLQKKMAEIQSKAVDFQRGIEAVIKK